MVDQISDEAAVARVLQGDTAAFELVMRRNNPRVYRTTRAILKDEAEAEEAMQQTYVSAYQHLADFNGNARFSTWLTRIAVHEALARLRRAKRTASLEDLTPEEEPMASTQSPEEAAGDVEMRALLSEAVDALPLGYRTVFVMCAVEEQTPTEAADILGIPPETVRTRLHRARGLLRDRLAAKLEGAASRVFELHLSRCDRVVAAVLARIRPSS